MITIYLTRHGETTENVAQILQGHLPGHLTEKGIEQAQTLSKELSLIKFDALLSSDLQRALDTAIILNEPHHLPITICPLLRERDWGELTGVSLLKKRSTVFPSNVESVEKMYERASAFLNYVVETYNNQTILAVGHGLFDRCIQATIEGKEIHDTPRMQNAEMRILKVERASKSQHNSNETEITAD
ncbi:MAG: histidine phosphatase family protein [Bacteroidaceae bacterium]